MISLVGLRFVPPQHVIEVHAPRRHGQSDTSALAQEPLGCLARGALAAAALVMIDSDNDVDCLGRQDQRLNAQSRQRRPARMVAHLHRAQRGLQAFAND
jgi:hypothetical protein